jgi:hypothetical protein
VWLNTAHRFAFLRLLDKCKVISLSVNEMLAYQLLLDLETIREHCFSILCYALWTIELVFCAMFYGL